MPQKPNKKRGEMIFTNVLIFGLFIVIMSAM